MDIRYINTNLHVADVFTKQLTLDKSENANYAAYEYYHGAAKA